MQIKGIHRVLAALLVLAFQWTTLSVPAYTQTTASSTALARDYTSALKSIEEKTEARQKELGIPGISLAIVIDDKIVYCKGLGFKDFENKIPVTADTQFAIGSATKAFTALSVLMSADEGKLSLQDSPKKYLPYFKMYDPETDKNIEIRDLLSHSSGLNRTDLAMITGKLNRAELIEVAAQAKPTAKLREKFQYQNIMFTAAGEIVAKVQKRPWEEFVPDRIFKPLGMKNSTMSMKQMQKASDYSFGYSFNFDTKETKRLPFREIDEVAPAGSINSSARDMAEWIRFVMNGGTVNGKRIVSEALYSEWLKPQMKVAGSTSYGFGWFLQDWNGLKVVQHGGNIDGFNSMVAMIPEKKTGFVLLTNVSASSLGTDVMSIVWKNILGENKPESVANLPAETLQKMTGKYRLAVANMDMEVKMTNGSLILSVPGQPDYPLSPTGGRNFKMMGAPDGFSVTFRPDQGDPVEMYLQQPQGNYILPKLGVVPPARVEGGKAAAAELVGTYTAPGGPATIEIRDEGGKITFNVSGQQPYELIETAKDLYAMSPLPESYSLRPKRNAGGKVESVVVKQPEGEFEFTAGAASVVTDLIGIDELHKKIVEAAGGEETLRRITSRVIEADIDLENQGVKAKSVSYAKAPNKVGNEITFTALGKVIGTGWDYFDGSAGEEAYSFAPAEKLAGKRLADTALSADLLSLLDWKTAYKKVAVTGRAKVDGEDAYVVVFEPKDGTPFKEYYSAKTFLLLKHEGVIPSSTSPQQLPFAVTYSDYRDVDGIKLPFKSVNESISNGTVVSVVRSVKQNVPVDEKMFAPRKLF